MSRSNIITASLSSLITYHGSKQALKTYTLHVMQLARACKDSVPGNAELIIGYSYVAKITLQGGGGVAINHIRGIAQRNDPVLYLTAQQSYQS